MDTNVEKFHSELLEEAKIVLIQKKESKLYNKILYGILFSYVILVLIILLFIKNDDIVRLAWIFFGFEVASGLCLLLFVVRFLLSYSSYRPKPSDEEIIKEYNAIVFKKTQNSQTKINELQESIEQEKKYFAKLTKV